MGKLSRSSLHDINGWKSQYDRMLRWYRRLLQGDDEDFIFAFFQNCYILKDWLKHDEIMSYTEYKKFSDENKCMEICGYICNGTKHGQLDGNLDNNPSIFREYVGQDLSEFFIQVNGEKWNAKVLAQQCIAAWNTVLDLHLSS